MDFERSSHDAENSQFKAEDSESNESDAVQYVESDTDSRIGKAMFDRPTTPEDRAKFEQELLEKRQARVDAKKAELAKMEELVNVVREFERTKRETSQKETQLIKLVTEQLASDDPNHHPNLEQQAALQAEIDADNAANEERHKTIYTNLAPNNRISSQLDINIHHIQREIAEEEDIIAHSKEHGA